MSLEENISVNEETAKILKSIISDLENINKQIEISKGQADEVFSFAKSKGFEPKIIRKVLKLRKLDQKKKDELEHEESIAKFLDDKITEIEFKSIT